MIEKLKKLKRVLVGKDFFNTYEITKVNKKRFGSRYGGWWVSTDNMEKELLIVFSFGLGEDISFDTQIMKKYNCKIYGFDPTPKSIKYIKTMKLDDKFKLYPYAVSDKNGSLTFNLPENENHISGSLENISSKNKIDVICKNMKTICDELEVYEIDILKMDIEGSEYKVIEDMIRSNIYPKQILVEYHHFFTNFKNKDTKQNIDLLIKNGYTLFHIDGYDYCFLRS